MQAAVLGHVLEGCYYPQSGPMQFVRGLVPTIRQAGGDCLVQARVDEILVDYSYKNGKGRATGVRLANGDEIHARHGVVSDAGIRSTLRNLLPAKLSLGGGPLHKLREAVEECSGGISHVFLFIGLNASTEELKLRSSSFYYIPWNETDASMDATGIQEFYRNTLLDPTIMDVSAGMVFCTAKDPEYSAVTMPGKSTVIVFSEARASDFEAFLEESNISESNSTGTGKGKGGRRIRSAEYNAAKELIRKKMLRSLLLNFPHLEPYVDMVEVGTPLTIQDYTLRFETLGLRHTPRRMTDMSIRPDCALTDLYFTGQDIAFAGWAGAMAGAMVTAQRLLGYTLLDFARGKTLMRDLGRGDVEDMIQGKVKEATKASALEVVAEVMGNGLRHLHQTLKKS
jgi:all-trans-retinol 13,14-reductase